MAEIQKADPKARRTALVIVGGGALVGVVLITIAGERRPDFEAWIEQDVHARLQLVTAGLTLLTTGPIFCIAGYSWRLGRRVVLAGRYPPPGLRIIRDTPVVIGEAAGRRGRVMQRFALVIGLAGLLVAFLLWRLVFLLERGTA